VVGLFALGALVLLAASILTLTSNRGPWIPRYTLVAYFGNVQGLIEGAPVRLAGKDVGIVEGVAFGAFGDAKPPIQVSMRVDTSVRERVRADSRAAIGTMGLLGDKYIELSMGSLEAEILADGAEIPAITPPDLTDVMAKGTQALDGIAVLAGNLNDVATQFEEARGAAKVAETAKGVSSIIDEVRNGRGLLHSLIYDEYKGGGVESISRSLARLEDILREIERGDGFAHQLIYEPASRQAPLAEIGSAAARLDSILAKIDRGEGTLGLLVSDPALYQDLRTLLGGANRSRVVRSLIRLSTPDGDDAPAEAAP
jgi:phospholipid/cholesterol/gamma-HCH transport system substrate-binding protein